MAYSARTLVQVTSDDDVTEVSTTLFSVVLTPDGTNDASVDIVDGAVGVGTVVLSLETPGTGPSAVWSGAALLADGVGVDLTGTGAVCSVEFDEN
jgi:hypothetical protein